MRKQIDTEDCIVIKGARVNNLKNIDVRIPRNSLVVITGVSGSGKSSLAFDTLYAEGQRRYVESLSSYARQFMGRKAKPEVDYIHGIAPAVAIEQKVNTTNPRSTVGTSTEIYEYLKLLFARIGRTYSPISGQEVRRHSVSDVVDYIYTLPEESKVMILAPLQEAEGRTMRDQLELLQQEGFVRISLNGTVVRIEDVLPDWTEGATGAEVSLLVDRLAVHTRDENQRKRVAESVQTAFFEGRGSCVVQEVVDEVMPQGTELDVQQYNRQMKELYSRHRHEFSNRFEADGMQFEKPNPNFFSFNNPYGACPTCQGYGSVIGIDEDLVVPNKTLSVYEDCVVCWKGEKMSECKRDFMRHAVRYDFPIHTPYCELTPEQKHLLWHGPESLPSIDAFFQWVETQQYKIQYRVLLSRYRGKTLCPECGGSRLRKDAGYVKIHGKNIMELTQMSVDALAEWLRELPGHLTSTEQDTSQRILTELHNRVDYLQEVGLGYLTLGRMSNTLSGGESQRINLATSLGSSLVGSMYILDEPSIGLHSRDTAQLIHVLQQLRDLGNTVIVVEHDEDIIRAADYLIDIGPAAGRLGGEVVFAGTIEELLSKDVQHSLTAQYLLGERSIAVPSHRKKWRDKVSVARAYCHNLKQVDAEFPLHVLTVVTGVSGSGKTSLVKGVLYDVLQKRLDGNPDYVGKCMAMGGDWKTLSAVELVDQNPIGRSTRSNPATYMKAYDEIRQLYALQPLAKARGYKAGWFSFNTEGGRCDVCEGEGVITIGMQFMADVQLVCEECQGTRFKEETLEVLFRGKNISQILDLTIDQAIEFFQPSPEEPAAVNTVLTHILDRLTPLRDVGLGYLMMGQNSSTLSGGEAQRVKLASYLVKGTNAQPTLFIFDEPSTGLHFHDIQKLIQAFRSLIERGHSIVVIEHHHDIIKVADWVIDLGPEGGDAGGHIVCAGTPEQVVDCAQSYTAKFLKEKLI